MSRFQLAIFDMDGTLVNSEPLAAAIVTPVLEAEFGIVMTGEEFADHYGGWNIETALVDIAKVHGIEYPTNFEELLGIRYGEIAPTCLEATKGAHEMLESMQSIRRCVASNGGPEYIQRSLDMVGLLPLFEATFSHVEVANPKPAPDLYQHAAQKMGVDASQCVVLEDRGLGVAAAQAAGMEVVGFIGNNVARRAELEPYDVEIIDDIRRFAAIACR